MAPMYFAQEKMSDMSLYEAFDKYSKRIKINIESPGKSEAQLLTMTNYEEAYLQLWMNDNWMDYQKTIEILDTVAKTLEMEIQLSIQQNWIPTMKYQITFEALNSTSVRFGTATTYSWDESDWVLAGRSIYYYDNNNYLVEIRSEVNLGDTILLYEKSLFTNNSLGQPLEEVQLKLNMSTSQFLNDYKYTYTYDNLNQLNLVNSIEASWNGNNWQDTAKTIYTRNSQLNVLTETNQYIIGGSEIVNNWYAEFTYDASGEYMTTLLNKYWETSSNSWLNNSRATLTYTNTNEILSEFYESFQSGIFVNSARTSYSYNNSNQRTEELNENFVSGDWQKSYRIIYFYSPTNIEGEGRIEGFSLEQNFPNPFNPSTTISFTIDNADLISLRLFDILGREVAILLNEYKTAGKHSVVFDASKLSSGTYFYQLSNGKNVNTKKAILIK